MSYVDGYLVPIRKIDVDAYRKCVDDPKTDDRIKKDGEMFKAAHGQGLPTIWVDEQRIVGAQPRDVFESAIANAGHRRR